MSKLIKFLRPYAGLVLAILAFLMVQAYCDLSLPTYTSDIVNVGIQQHGIKEMIPYHITQEDLTKLLALTDQDKQKMVRDAYEKDDQRSTKSKEVLQLKSSVKKDENKVSDMEDALKKPMFLMLTSEDEDLQKEIGDAIGSSSQSGSDAQAAQSGQAAQSTGDTAQAAQSTGDTAQAAGGTADAAAQQSQLTPEVLKEINKKLDEMPDTMLDQTAVEYNKQAYKDAGVNVDNLQRTYVLQTGLIMLGLAAIGLLASVSVGFMASRTGAGVGRRLRGQVFRKVIGYSNAEFDQFSTASLITRSTNDIQQIQQITVIMLRMVLYAPVMAIGAIWKVFHTNLSMLWIIGVAVGLVVAIVAVLFVVVMPKFKVIQQLVDKLNLVSREILTGLPVIRAFNTQKYEEKRFDKANKDFTRTNLFVNRAMTFMMPTMMLVMNVITVLIVWIGAHSVNDGGMQVGDMMAFIQYTMQIIMAFLMLTVVSVMLPRAAVSAKRVDDVLQSKSSILDPKKPVELPAKGNGRVEFKDVSFRYPGAEEDVIHNASFSAEPGQTLVIIGSTGSGKSTLINLIPRFYDVTEGSITVDGVDIRDVTQHDLRSKIGYVPQKGVLFSGTIESNIMYSDPEGGEARMKEAAQIAQATEFIEADRNGYDSSIAQGGDNVSGGQKQRLSIARAIAKKPEIYIFDDSFSALDYKTDLKLRTELKKSTADSTVIIVAQRISTILQAEKILVLDDGEIVGAGTHQELLKSCDAYYQIASSQLSEQELAQDMKEVG